MFRKFFALILTLAVGCTSAQLKATATLAVGAACIAVKPICTAATRACGPILEASPLAPIVPLVTSGVKHDNEARSARSGSPD